MMTPTDVAEHKFSMTRFSGYNVSEVDDFLDQLTKDYTDLYKENAVLKSKMKVIAEKIREYQNNESSVARLVTKAEQEHDEIIAQAQKEKEAIIANVNIEAEERRKDLEKEIAVGEKLLEQSRASTINFADSMRIIVERQQKNLDEKRTSMISLMQQQADCLQQEIEFLNRLDEIRVLVEKRSQFNAQKKADNTDDDVIDNADSADDNIDTIDNIDDELVSYDDDELNTISDDTIE